MGMVIRRSYFCIRGKHPARGTTVWRVMMTCMVIGASLLFAVLPDTVRAAKEDGVAQQTAAPQEKDIEGERGVVARVNGVEIMQAALKTKMMRMLAARNQEDSSGGGPRQIEAFRRDALNKLVVQELAYQRAKAEGIVIGKDELDNAIAEIKEAKGGEEQYREALGSKHMTENELRKDLERNLMVKHIFEKEVARRIVISEEKMREEYDQIKDEFSKPEKVVVDDIVLFLALDDGRALSVAEALLKKINADPNKDPLDLTSDGTFLGREVELNKNKQKELYAAALKLKEGEISGVIRTEDSFHIIKLKKYEPEVKADFAQIRGFIERRLRAQGQQKRMAEWEAEMKKDAKIEILDDRKDAQ